MRVVVSTERSRDQRYRGVGRRLSYTLSEKRNTREFVAK